MRRLERFRLDRGWGYPQLSAAIHALTNIHIEQSTLNRACQRPVRSRKTTIDAVERFLAAQRNGASQEASR